MIVPTPPSIIAESTNNTKLGTSNQKLMLFNLGNAISGPPTISGIKKLPKPPIKAGIHISLILGVKKIPYNFSPCGWLYELSVQSPLPVRHRHLR